MAYQQLASQLERRRSIRGHLQSTWTSRRDTSIVHELVVSVHWLVVLLFEIDRRVDSAVREDRGGVVEDVPLTGIGPAEVLAVNFMEVLFGLIMSAGRGTGGRTKDDIGRVPAIVRIPVVKVLLLVVISGYIESPVVFDLKSPEEWIFCN